MPTAAGHTSFIVGQLSRYLPDDDTFSVSILIGKAAKQPCRPNRCLQWLLDDER